MQKRRILVVDDEVDQTEIIQEWLGASFDVVVKNDSTEALEIAESEPFDLLITDFSMPELNGASLVAKVTRVDHNRDIAVILLTGINDDLAISVIKSIPRIKFVEKPIRRNEFMVLVEEQLRLV